MVSGTFDPPRGRQRRRFEVRGTVQGVGFRPFVHRLAARHELGGFVRNDGAGVVIEVEGAPGSVDAFAQALLVEAAFPAQVERVLAEGLAVRGELDFAVAPSDAHHRAAAALVPPDIATCEECRRELFDPGNRRHRHPFISCTACGPRFTIARGAPYDRATTTMAAFPLCGDCRREYEDPLDRRFHAQTIACSACGPSLWLDAKAGSAALAEAVVLLGEGAIVAVKGLGGWHLACLAGDERAVGRLRQRKGRDHKPFALMAADPQELVRLTAAEAALMRSPERPIVLARRRPGAAVAGAVAPGSPWLGVMLPYTPVHHLLLHDLGGAPLVMTSGNVSDEPIATDDADAARRLGPIADALLGHDRRIERRCEDSVARAGFPVRRARGYAPRSLRLPVAARTPVVAAGGQLKAAFCVARGSEALLSPHLGDLESELARGAFEADMEIFLQMLGVRPEVVAHDLHPDYASTIWASRQEAELVPVQHHHAHAAACLAEHGERGPALALVFDGTGYGADGTLWGGELLRCDLEDFERVAHLEPVPLAGGEAAVREPWRAAGAYLERTGRPAPFERWPLVRRTLALGAPLSSGMGRLFDAVAAILGVRESVTYEGQAAIELELLAAGTEATPYACAVADGLIRGADLVAAVHDDLAAGRPRAEIAAAFHEGVAAAASEACAQAGEPRTVVLSGGSFQNLRLLASIERRLRQRGFEVLSHRLVPPNDGGVAYGQAAVAAARGH